MNDSKNQTTAQVDRKSRFVTKAWYVALWSEELPEGRLISQTIMNIPVVLFRQGNGQPAALLDRCPHRFAPLSMGHLLPESTVQCPYHGLEFSAAGVCTKNPHPPNRIPAGAHVRAFQVIEKYSMVWIWMGEGSGDPADIPDYSFIDQAPSIHITDPGYLNVKAHYELVVYNLMDLSHVVYVHPGILGSAQIVASEIEIQQTAQTVTVKRVARNVETPGMFKMMSTEIEDHGDSFTEITWYAPSNLFLRTGSCPTGAPQESGTGYLAIHLLTPETDRTTHYRYSAVRWNVQTKGEAENIEIRRKIAELRTFAFTEQDAPIIEAQQRRIDSAYDNLNPILLSIDGGPRRCQQILEKVLHAESP
jgi:phenylpropionate dioxygenase-like ring-hydroxylating dioxygenase large terminal subunit